MMMQEYIEQAEQDLLHTYNRYPVVFDHGDGVHLYSARFDWPMLLYLLKIYGLIKHCLMPAFWNACPPLC